MVSATIILIRILPLGESMLGNASGGERYRTPLCFLLDAKLQHNQLPSQTFQQSAAYQAHAEELSRWPGSSDRGLRSLDSLALPTAECQSRWPISETLHSEPYFSQLSALPSRPCATHSCPTSDRFPGPPRKQAFCKKRSLLYLKLWGLAGVRPEFYSQILSVFGLLLVFLLAF